MRLVVTAGWRLPRALTACSCSREPRVAAAWRGGDACCWGVALVVGDDGKRPLAMAVRWPLNAMFALSGCCLTGGGRSPPALVAGGCERWRGGGAYRWRLQLAVVGVGGGVALADGVCGGRLLAWVDEW